MEWWNDEMTMTIEHDTADSTDWNLFSDRDK